MQQRPEITKMQRRISYALASPSVIAYMRDDLDQTFTEIGLDEDRKREVIKCTLANLAYNFETGLEAMERNVYEVYKKIKIHGHSIIDIYKEKMQGRAKTIYGQVSPFLQGHDSIIDWGCGDGQVTDLVHRSISVNVVGYDVCHYPAPGIVTRVRQFDGKKVPARKGYFQAGMMTNVAHHAEDNSKILRELARVIRPGGRLVVIESVPINGESEEMERTFINDYIHNRLFRNDDIPVPGTYETQGGWVRRFAEAGFRLEHLDSSSNPVLLGYDHPMIRVYHTLLVLQRTK